MKLILKRIAKRKAYTIGRLYVRTEEVEEFRTYTSDKYLCDTLEPPCIEMKVDRTVEEVLNDKALLRSIKPCAIPEGEYRVTMTYSPKYKTQLPLITGDSRFNSLWQGIRIHAGNTAKDTQGCILVGENKIVGMVLNSRLTLTKVKNLLKGKGSLKLRVKS
jgi:hypothetical protein